MKENRIYWALSFFGFLFIILGALYFQYFKNMQPCYLCIIQRIGVIISIIGSGIGFINPKNSILRNSGIITVLAGLSVSLTASIKLVYMQLNPPIFSSCGMSADELMDNFGFLKSLPMLFEGSASCTESAGGFLNITFEQWTLAMFSIITISLITILIKTRRKNKNV